MCLSLFCICFILFFNFIICDTKYVYNVHDLFLSDIRDWSEIIISRLIVINAGCFFSVITVFNLIEPLLSAEVIKKRSPVPIMYVHVYYNMDKVRIDDVFKGVLIFHPNDSGAFNDNL